MNTPAKNHRLLKIVLELKDRVRRAQFHIDTKGKYGWPRAQRLVAVSQASIQINQSRIEKLRTQCEINFLPK